MTYQELIISEPHQWRSSVDWLYVLYTLERKNNLSLPEELGVTKACVSNWRKTIPSKKGAIQLLELLEESNLESYLIRDLV